MRIHTTEQRILTGDGLLSPEKVEGDMRELKFRGKRISGGEWVEGDLTQYSEAMSYITINLVENEVHQVHTSTVGQYTGLKDKNGKEIYEGDILKDNNGKVYKIVWGNDLLWLAKTNEIHCNCYCPKGISTRAEVIGNIYENPELLEGME